VKDLPGIFAGMRLSIPAKVRLSFQPLVRAAGKIFSQTYAEMRLNIEAKMTGLQERFQPRQVGRR
jgi:hypothetical protein